jgi:hypothetical protein
MTEKRTTIETDDETARIDGKGTEHIPASHHTSQIEHTPEWISGMA